MKRIGDIQAYKYVKINGTKYYLDERKEEIFYILGKNRKAQVKKANDEQLYKNYVKQIEINTSAINYYKEAYKFSKFVKGALENLSVNHNKLGIKDTGDGKIFKNENIEYAGSNFNLHRKEVIRKSIESNLSAAIANFNSYTNAGTNFQMPKLKETEWEMLENEVSIISFLQGLNLGTKLYNGYTVVTNSKTKEFVSEESIYISDGEYYHKINDKCLVGNGPIAEGIVATTVEVEKTLQSSGNLSQNSESLLSASEVTINDYGGYVINYVSPNGVNDEGIQWRIFHSDGTNIYLIADDYVSDEYVPNGKSGSTIYKNWANEYSLSFDRVYNDYTGWSDISGTTIASKWLRKYAESSYTSNNINMKATAYMLDISVWNPEYANDYAEYAIGGPTLELFAASYNATHDKDINTNVSSRLGYKVKWNSDTNYSDFINGIDSLGNLYIKESTQKTKYMWLASPANTYNDYLMSISYGGTITSRDYYYGTEDGLRPIICLKSDIKLEKQEDATYKILGPGDWNTENQDNSIIKTIAATKAVLDLDYETRKDAATGINYVQKGGFGCYKSIIGQENVNNKYDSIYEYLREEDDINQKIKQIYYIALGRERAGTYKIENLSNINTILNNMQHNHVEEVIPDEPEETIPEYKTPIINILSNEITPNEYITYSQQPTISLNVEISCETEITGARFMWISPGSEGEWQTIEIGHNLNYKSVTISREVNIEGLWVLHIEAWSSDKKTVNTSGYSIYEDMQKPIIEITDNINSYTIGTGKDNQIISKTITVTDEGTGIEPASGWYRITGPNNFEQQNEDTWLEDTTKPLQIQFLVNEAGVYTLEVFVSDKVGNEQRITKEYVVTKINITNTQKNNIGYNRIRLMNGVSINVPKKIKQMEYCYTTLSDINSYMYWEKCTQITAGNKMDFPIIYTLISQNNFVKMTYYLHIKIIDFEGNEFKVTKKITSNGAIKY